MTCTQTKFSEFYKIYTQNIRHGLKYKLFNKFQVPRTFTFYTSSCLIIPIVLCNIVTHSLYQRLKKEAQYYYPNSKMLSYEYLIHSTCERVTGVEANWFYQNGAHTVLFALILTYKVLSIVLCFDFFQTRGGSTSWSRNMKLRGKNRAFTSK